MENPQNTHPTSWSPSFPQGPSNDLVLQSSDGAHFAVHKLILSLASPVFMDMFEVAHRSQPEEPVPLTEERFVLESLLNLIYHRETPSFTSLDEILPTLSAAHKYQVGSAVQVLLQHIIKPPRSFTPAVTMHQWSPMTILNSDPLRVYAVARRLGLRDLEIAAREEWFNEDPSDLDTPSHPDVDEMPHGWYRDLLKARARRRSWLDDQEWYMGVYMQESDYDWEDDIRVQVQDDYDVAKMRKELLDYPSLRRIRTIRGNIHEYFEKTAILGALDLLEKLTDDLVKAFPEANIHISYMRGET